MTEKRLIALDGGGLRMVSRWGRFEAYWIELGKPQLEWKYSNQDEWSLIDLAKPFAWIDHCEYRIAGDRHWQLRKAWVNGDRTLPIELQNKNGSWIVTHRPGWNSDIEYREAQSESAKPEVTGEKSINEDSSLFNAAEMSRKQNMKISLDEAIVKIKSMPPEEFSRQECFGEREHGSVRSNEDQVEEKDAVMKVHGEHGYSVFDFGVVEDKNNPENNGGKTDYYDVPEDSETLNDLIEYKDMTWHIANVFKACYRYGEKDTASKIYDLNKMIYSAQRQLALELKKHKGEG
jgi:hypothetical protein